ALWGQVWTHHTIYGPLGSSMEALSLGFLLSLAIGIPVGIAMGRWRAVEHVLDPYISFLYALPHVAFIPVMVFWLGFRLEFRLAYVVLSGVFPVIINTMGGVKNIDQELLAGGRQAFSSAWVVVFVAEVLSTHDGLGGLINHYADYFLTADMYVPILAIMAIAITIQNVASWLQVRLTPWSNTARRERGGNGG